MYLQARLKSGKTIHYEIKKERTYVGRGTNSEFIIEDDSVSRQHVAVDSENGSFFITDLNSANGTFINEVKLLPMAKTPFNSFFPAILGFHIELRLMDDVQGYKEFNI